MHAPDIRNEFLFCSQSDQHSISGEDVRWGTAWKACSVSSQIFANVFPLFQVPGQISVFAPYEGPCYRCLFPEPPPADLSPNCTQAGVFGVLPGIIGTMQALEAIKLIAGVGESLDGRLLVLDGLRLQWRELRLRADPACPVCGR